MKKNYLFLFAMIVVAMCGFVSCGSDDDDDDNLNGSGKDVFNPKDTIQDLKIRSNECVYKHANLLYNSNESILTMKLLTEDIGSGTNRFHFSGMIYFHDIILSKLKVGEDLTKYISMKEIVQPYDVSNIYMYHNTKSTQGDFYNSKRCDAIGDNQSSSIDNTIKIVYIDKDKKYMYLKFNITFYTAFGSNSAPRTNYIGVKRFDIIQE